MSSAIAKYRKHIAQMNLSVEEGDELIGALMGIVEKLLAKKYGLSGEQHDEKKQVTD